MKKNIGSIDKIVRIIIAIIIAALGFYYQTWWGLLALIPLITVFTSFCGLYPILGINTRKEKND
jgi:hypothetical protein